MRVAFVWRRVKTGRCGGGGYEETGFVQSPFACELSCIDAEGTCDMIHSN